MAIRIHNWKSTSFRMNYFALFLLNMSNVKAKSKAVGFLVFSRNRGVFVAKLLYKSKCPSVSMSICQPRLGGNVIFSAPN